MKHPGPDASTTKTVAGCVFHSGERARSEFIEEVERREYIKMRERVEEVFAPRIRSD
jgi:hypothetical protein